VEADEDWEGDIEAQVLAPLEQLIKLLLHGRLTAEQADFVCGVSLPRLTAWVLKLRLPSSATLRVASYLHFVLEVSVALVRKTDYWEIVDTVRYILTDSQAYHFYAPAPSKPGARGPGGRAGASRDAGGAEQGGGLDEEERSSGDHSGSEGSRSDDGRPEVERACEWYSPSEYSPSEDVSPLYIRSVEVFHAAGGFDTLVARIAQTPLLNLTAVLMLLRPLVKVKEVLKKAVLQGHLRRVEAALTHYVSALSDEVLKLADRKSMGDLHKCLEALYDHARLPGAQRLDKLRLALALKCLRTPNLEKRLHGLSEIKEMIVLLLHKQEYLRSFADRAEREGRTHRGASPAVQLQLAQSAPELLVEWLQRERVV